MTSARESIRSRPGLRVIDRLGARRILRLVAVVYVLGFTVAVLLKEPVAPLRVGRDLVTYLAAGERLNAGHELYGLQPGDRQVPLQPPYWTAPLLSPPPIAVLWRPLAAVGEIAAVVWWLGGVVATIVFVGWVLRWGDPIALLGIVTLTPAIVLTAISGNANAYLTPLLAAAWVFRERPWGLGLSIATACAVKLTPVALGTWLISARRLLALAATLVVGLGILALSTIGAGAESWVDWIVTVPSSAPTDLSLAALTGVPSVVIATIGGLVALAAGELAVRRSREGLAFATSVAVASLTSPALYFAPIAMLAAALAPAVRRRQERGPVLRRP